MESNTNTQNRELITTLEAVLGSEVVVTPAALARGLACVVEVLSKAQAQREESATDRQEYATPKQLAKKLGASKHTVLRSLNKLVSEGHLKPLRLPQDGEGHPRYKIADVLALCADSA